MSYCEKCGSKVSENAKFCGSCGHQILSSDENIDKINSENSYPNSVNQSTKRSVSKTLIISLVVVIIVAAIFIIKDFQKKSEEISNPEEAFHSETQEIKDGDLSFIFSEDDDEFRDGLFNFGLESKSNLIKDVLQHLRKDNITGKLTGCDYQSLGAIDGISYESEFESEYDFKIEVYQFENEEKLQKTINEGSLSDLKEHGGVYANDCIVLFITNDYRDYGYNTDEISNKIIESFMSFKKGELPNNFDNIEFTYETYKNNRGYQIDYPSYLKISPSVENNDGTSFISSDGETKLAVWSSYYSETDNPISENYELDLNEEDFEITYKVKKDSWYIVSGFTITGKIFYKKVFKSEVGAGTVTMYFEYPENEKERYNSILPHVVESFKDL